MLYVSGVYALNLPCKLDLQGDWHMSALDWKKITFLNSADSIYKDYGIEQSYSNSLVNLYNVNKANYKNVRKAHSFRCGMDSTKIKKIMCM